MHIQKIFVILAFNNQLLETLISLLVQIPVVGVNLESPVRSILGAKFIVSFSFSFFFCSKTEREVTWGRQRERQ